MSHNWQWLCFGEIVAQCSKTIEPQSRFLANVSMPAMRQHHESLETHLRLNYVEALRATTTEIPTDRKCRRARCGLRDRRK
jgi:hypothetical protein